MSMEIGRMHVEIGADTQPFELAMRRLQDRTQAANRGFAAAFNPLGALTDRLGRIGMAGLGLATLRRGAEGLAS